jgi:hypothetical protein
MQNTEGKRQKGEGEKNFKRGGGYTSFLDGNIDPWVKGVT